MFNPYCYVDNPGLMSILMTQPKTRGHVTRPELALILNDWHREQGLDEREAAEVTKAAHYQAY